MTSRFPTLALLLLATSLPASASDGVLEINHACAVNTGCFPGDTAGYPVTIDGSAGRSYRLTSDLVVPDENTSGIWIEAPSVSVDLGGFEIIRSGCVGAQTDCTPTSGTGTGVWVLVSGSSGVSVRNGGVVGMGNRGVLLGIQAIVTNVHARWNQGNGIETNGSSIVSGNTAYQNGGSGIHAVASTISGNTAADNGVYGISADLGSTISGNTAYANGDDGISSGRGATVSNNTARANTGFGLDLTFGNDSSYRGNTITDNTAGTVNGGVDLGANSCDGAPACP